MYDTTLGALFVRVSDIMNDLIGKAKVSGEANGNIDYSCFSLKNLTISIEVLNSDEEKVFLDVIMNEALMCKQRGLSDEVVLKSLMAFFIKPFGFDQIDRYAQNRGIDSKEYGYMLRGALIGYTAFPKTFTDALYTNTDIYIPMDEYLTAIHKQVETQHPCD